MQIKELFLKIEKIVRLVLIVFVSAAFISSIPEVMLMFDTKAEKTLETEFVAKLPHLKIMYSDKTFPKDNVVVNSRNSAMVSERLILDRPLSQTEIVDYYKPMLLEQGWQGYTHTEQINHSNGEKLFDAYNFTKGELRLYFSFPTSLAKDRDVGSSETEYWIRVIDNIPTTDRYLSLIKNKPPK